MEADLQKISINGKEYVAADSVRDQSLSSEVRIVVLQRGWIYVGYYSKVSEDEHRLDSAKCIRSWGTSKGLGELLKGPTATTKLDDSGVVRFHPMTVVCSLDCEVKAWKKHL